MSGDSLKLGASSSCAALWQSIPVPEIDDSPMCSIRRSKLHEDDPEYFLPTLPLVDNIPRISCSTLVSLLNGEYDEFFRDLFVVDCRYNYEYEGGHIRGAISVNDPAVLETEFFGEAIANSVFVFHCEFSHNRGPQLAGIFREIDRAKNSTVYPNLFYPNVFVLDGGYRQIFRESGEECDGGYTEMLDENHRGDVTRETSIFRTNIERFERRHRKGLVAVPRFASSQNFLKSPLECKYGNSPVSTRMLGFLASPLQRRSP